MEFLVAVKAEALTSPTMTGEWEFKLRQMEQSKFAREDFMREVVDQTSVIIENVKTFEEDESTARRTDIVSPTDNQPLIETLRAYKSQDGLLAIYKIVGGRKMEETEIKELVEKRKIGPLDGFVSARTSSRFSALLQLVYDT